MVAFSVAMPHVGESVTEAIIGKWLVGPGDEVRKFDPIVEVVTDKVNMEVPAPVDGTVTSLVAQEGSTIPMGSVIAKMDVDASVAESAKADGGGAPAEDSDSDAADRIGTMIVGANVGPTGGAFQDTSLDVAEPSSDGGGSDDAAAATNSGPDAADSRASVYSPVVVRLAASHGIDLGNLVGTGRGGRVTKSDVERYLETRAAAGSDSREASPVEVQIGTDDEVVTPSPIRRIIAERMSTSVREIPHAWAALEVDMTNVVRFRDENRDRIYAESGRRLTYLPISVYIVSRSLRRHRQINSSWVSGDVVLRGRVNLGIAVAAQSGLVVPVLKDADTSDLVTTVVECARLVDGARDGTLGIEDVQDGTFTLNNTGAFGSFLGGAIINHPQAAILNTEGITRRPAVVAHPDGTESIGIRPMMNLCLSFDHRIVDGAEAMAFLQDLKSVFEADDFGSAA